MFFSCDVCWNENVSTGDEISTDLVQPFDPLAASNDSDTLVGKNMGSNGEFSID